MTKDELVQKIAEYAGDDHQSQPGDRELAEKMLGLVRKHEEEVRLRGLMDKVIHEALIPSLHGMGINPIKNIGNGWPSCGISFPIAPASTMRIWLSPGENGKIRGDAGVTSEIFQPPGAILWFREKKAGKELPGDKENPPARGGGGGGGSSNIQCLLEDHSPGDISGGKTPGGWATPEKVLRALIGGDFCAGFIDDMIEDAEHDLMRLRECRGALQGLTKGLRKKKV